MNVNPVQYFKLNESGSPTAVDSSNSAQNGAYVGAIAFGANGPLLEEASTAITMPGGTSSVGVALPALNRTAGKSYTIQTWIYPIRTSTYMTIWGADGKHRLLLSAAGLLLSQFDGNFFSKSAVSFNAWHDIVFVYDAAAKTASYYIDAKLNSAAGIPAAYGAFTSAYYVGQYDASVNYKFKGSIAQHAVYPIALTPAQVAVLHQSAGYPVAQPLGNAPSPAPSSSPTPSGPIPSPTPSAIASPTPSPVPSNSPTPAPSGAPRTIPFFQSSFTYAGKTYKYSIVGTNPQTNPIQTTIGAQIVPIRLVFSNGTTYDATAAAATIPNSPLFTNGSYTAGNTQFGDAFMRSQFWAYAANTNYHVLLSKPAIEPTVQVTVPSGDGSIATQSNGQLMGEVTYAWFVQTIEPQIIQQLGLDPATLTIFATANTKVLEPGGRCCYAGYHSSFQMNTKFGPSIATTAWASVAVNGVETLSHEIGEWLDDPFYTNVVPGWVNPISNSCNGDQFEVGDPVTNHAFYVNGFGLQDLVFYSWFSRNVPSIGINGRYDLMGEFRSPAPLC
jgi:hypothetical protein